MSNPRSHPNKKGSTSVIIWIFWVWLLAQVGFTKGQTTFHTITGLTTVTPSVFSTSLTTIISFVGGETHSSTPSSTVSTYTVDLIPDPSMSTTFRQTESAGNTGPTSGSAFSFTLVIPITSPTATTLLTTTSSAPSSTGSVTSSPTGNLTVTQHPQSGLDAVQKGVIGGVIAPLCAILVGATGYALWKYFAREPSNAKKKKEVLNQQPPTQPRSSYPPREAVEMFNRIWWTRQGAVAPPLEPVREEVDILDYQSRERDREAQGQDPFNHELGDSYFDTSGILPIQHPVSPRLPAYSNSVRHDEKPGNTSMPPNPLRSHGRSTRSPPPRPQRPESLTESLINTIASIQGPFIAEDLFENGVQFEPEWDRTSQQLCSQIPGDDSPFDERVSTEDRPERDATLTPEPLKIVKKSASDATPYVTSLEADEEAEADGDGNDYGKTRRFLNKTGERLNPRNAINKVMNRNPRENGRMAISEPRDGSFVTAISNDCPLDVGIRSPPGIGLPVETMRFTTLINASRASSLEKITEEEKSRNREETLAALEGETIEKPLRVEPKYRGSSMYSQDEYGRPICRAPRVEADEEEWHGNKDAFRQNVYNARGTFGSVASSDKRGELNRGKLEELNQF